MREPVTYQDILEKGRVEGRIDGERRILLRQATRRFGAPTDAMRARIERVTDQNTLYQLADRVLTAASWDELLADLA